MNDYVVKKNSWHYRLIYSHSGLTPRDLCQYRRALASALISRLFLGFMIMLLLLIAGWIVGSTVSWAVACIVHGTLIMLLPDASVFDMGTAVGLCLLTITLIWSACAIVKRGFVWLIHGPTSNTNDESLFRQYMRARKEKWCPKIVYVDE